MSLVISEESLASSESKDQVIASTKDADEASHLTKEILQMQEDHDKLIKELGEFCQRFASLRPLVKIANDPESTALNLLRHIRRIVNSDLSILNDKSQECRALEEELKEIQANCDAAEAEHSFLKQQSRYLMIQAQGTETIKRNSMAATENMQKQIAEALAKNVELKTAVAIASSGELFEVSELPSLEASISAIESSIAHHQDMAHEAGLHLLQNRRKSRMGSFRRMVHRFSHRLSRS